MSYSIRLADHFRYRDAGEEYDLEPVATADEALRLARGIVDRSLDRLWKPGMGAAELLAAYNTFGEDPCIVARAGAPGASSAPGPTPRSAPGGSPDGGGGRGGG